MWQFLTSVCVFKDFNCPLNHQPNQLTTHVLITHILRHQPAETPSSYLQNLLQPTVYLGSCLNTVIVDSEVNRDPFKKKIDHFPSVTRFRQAPKYIIVDLGEVIGFSIRRSGNSQRWIQFQTGWWLQRVSKVIKWHKSWKWRSIWKMFKIDLRKDILWNNVRMRSIKLS